MCRVFRHLGGDVRLDLLFSPMHDPYGIQYLRPNEALQNVRLRAGLQCPLREHISREGRENDDARRGLLASDCNDGIQAAHVRHLKIHQCHIRIELPVKLHRFPAVRSFSHQLHIGLGGYQSSNPGSQQGMVVCRKNADEVRVVHDERRLVNLGSHATPPCTRLHLHSSSTRCRNRAQAIARSESIGLF